MSIPTLRSLRVPAALLAIFGSAMAVALAQAGPTTFNVGEQFRAHAIACALLSPELATDASGAGTAPPCLADEPQRPVWHYGDPPPPPSDPARPEVLKDPKYEEWLDKSGVQGCDLNLYQTGSDLQRDPNEPVPPGQNKDPAGVTLPTQKAGGCECKIAIEAGWLATATPAERDAKVAHEICHCRQAKYGNLEWVDENGKVKTPAKFPVSTQTREDDASICSDVLNAGNKPRPRPLYKPR